MGKKVYEEHENSASMIGFGSLNVKWEKYKIKSKDNKIYFEVKNKSKKTPSLIGVGLSLKGNSNGFVGWYDNSIGKL
jgi:hypothetical protein